MSFTIEWEGRPSVITISQVGGAGSDMFHVSRDNWHILRIWQTPLGWTWDTPPKSQLYSEDIQTLIDIVLERFSTDDHK